MYGLLDGEGYAPEILHYASFKRWPELSVSIVKPRLGGIRAVRYDYEGMRARAIGAWFPELEPQRIAPNKLWKKTLEEFDGAIVVAGSSHIGLPVAVLRKPYILWASSTVYEDRGSRLTRNFTPSAIIEKTTLPAIERAERRALSDARHVLAVSDSAARTLKSVSQLSNVGVYPFPVDTEFFSDAGRDYQTSQPRILFVGRAEDPRKNIELFFQSADSISARRDVTFVVVSQQGPPDKIAKSYPNVIAHTEFVHDANRTKLAELYRSANALFITSEQEGLCIAGLEAMACGTPVISTRCGGPESYVNGRNGKLVESTADAFRDAALDYLNDKQQLERAGSEARLTATSGFSHAVWDQRFKGLIRNFASELNRL